MNDEQLKKKAEDLIARHNVCDLNNKDYMLNNIQLLDKLMDLIKQDRKAWIEELIGEDEPDVIVERHPDGSYTTITNRANQLRAEMRKRSGI